MHQRANSIPPRSNHVGIGICVAITDAVDFWICDSIRNQKYSDCRAGFRSQQFESDLYRSTVCHQSVSSRAVVYAVVLWVFPSLLSAIAMVREKEKGTILQVYTSSLSATELILGKTLAYLMVGLAVTLVVMGSGSLIFQVGFAGDPTPLLIGTPIYLTAAVLFGVLLGIRSGNQNAAVQGVSLIGFLTAFLLSGFIYPLSNIPFPLSLVPNIVPARYFIVITRDAFVRGIGWTGIWFDMVMLILLGLLLFNIARRLLSQMQLPD